MSSERGTSEGSKGRLEMVKERKVKLPDFPQRENMRSLGEKRGGRSGD